MLDHFKDVFRHMQWADARIWGAALDAPAAVADASLLEILQHIHETQHAFLDAWLRKPFERWERSTFGTAAEICVWATGFYPAAEAFLESLTEEDLAGRLVLPWARHYARSIGREPSETTLRETLHQVVSHSMHHRGQVARGLRLLGGSPPNTDYIVWLWQGRPDPDWPPATYPAGGAGAFGQRSKGSRRARRTGSPPGRT